MKYSKEKIRECVDWVRENGLMDYGGAKLSEFCRAMCIDNKTYYGWMRNSDFSEAIKKAKEDFKKNIQMEIEKSLAKVARGYSWEQTTTEYENDGTGKAKIKKQIRRTIEVEPNVGAAIFILTNIDPDKWKNKQVQDLNAKVTGSRPVIMFSGDDVDEGEKEDTGDDR